MKRGSYRPLWGAKRHLLIKGGHYRCQVCKTRHARGGLQGYCRRCAADAGLYRPLTPSRWDPCPDGMPVRLLRDAIFIPADRLQPRPPIERVYEGQSFLVIWNGA